MKNLLIKCPQCSKQISSEYTKCPSCGVNLLIIDNPNQKASAIPSATITDLNALGTDWLKFWNYFSLPVGGVVGLLMSFWLTALEIIIMVPLAILQFIVAYGLHHRKLWAWKWNWVIIISSFIFILIPPLTQFSHGGEAEIVVPFVIFSLVIRAY